MYRRIRRRRKRRREGKTKEREREKIEKYACVRVRKDKTVRPRESTTTLF